MVDNKIRDLVLERDKHTCQFGVMFGIPELTGVPCNDDLQVHHKTYENFNNEDPDELITVCSRCHDVITDYVRRLRFSTRDYEPVDLEKRLPDLLETKKVNSYKPVDFDTERPGISTEKRERKGYGDFRTQD